MGCRVAHEQTLSCSSSSEEKSPMVFSTDPHNTKTIGMMTFHCFLRLIRSDLTSSSYITEKSCVMFVPVTHIFLKYITTHTHTVTLESQFSCGLVEPIMPYTNSWSKKILVVRSCHSCRYTAP